MRLCAVSVDLDEIPNYFAIHGLPEPLGTAKTLVYDLAVDRLVALAREVDIPLTLFAVGSDLARDENAARLRTAYAAGCEIANHTLDHRYDLVRLGRDAIRRQVKEGAHAIERATGVAPVGFRAPGYTISDEVFSVLEELGVAYDSSVFPCPLYWAAKTAAIAFIGARGRSSRSIVDTPLVLLAPTRPYRVGRPYWRPGDGMVELPIQVTRGLRIHVIGTTLTLGGSRGARWLTNACIGEPLVNLELHGIDVLDADDANGALSPIRSHVPEVRIGWRGKVESLRETIAVLRAAGYAFVTLATAAREIQGSSGPPSERRAAVPGVPARA